MRLQSHGLTVGGAGGAKKESQALERRFS